MVVLNRIYTRTGDDGTTALGTGERRKKYDLRVAAYGTLDEVNAVIGLARLHTADDPRSMRRWRASRTICSTSRPTLLPRRRKGPGGARSDRHRRAGAPGSKARSTGSMPTLAPLQLVHPAGRQRRRPPICISPAPSAGAPSGIMVELNDQPGESVTPAALQIRQPAVGLSVRRRPLRQRQGRDRRAVGAGPEPLRRAVESARMVDAALRRQSVQRSRTTPIVTLVPDRR